MSSNDNSSIKQLLQERRQVKGGATDTAVDPAWSGLAPFNTEMAHGGGGGRQAHRWKEPMGKNLSSFLSSAKA